MYLKVSKRRGKNDASEIYSVPDGTAPHLHPHKPLRKAIEWRE